jgi:hypothetical protein
MDFGNTSAGGASSEAIGGVGGHVGTLDGAVEWKPIRHMVKYKGSRLWEDSGCFAMW